MKKMALALFCSLTGVTMGYFCGKILFNLKNTEDSAVVRLDSYYDTLNGWLRFKQSNKKMDDFLLKSGYQKIAIYGMGEMGMLLYDELKKSRVKVVYGIDRNSQKEFGGLNVISPESDLSEVDVVIVSVGFAYSEICSVLKEKVNCPVLSLQNLVYEIALSDEGVY